MKGPLDLLKRTCEGRDWSTSFTVSASTNGDEEDLEGGGEVDGGSDANGSTRGAGGCDGGGGGAGLEAACAALRHSPRSVHLSICNAGVRNVWRVLDEF